jgi:hypothetical protein
MARIRTIKPEFQQSQSMGRISRDARLTFILLWPQCDDSGRVRGNMTMLSAILFPYDQDSREKFPDWIKELEGENCITRYSVDADEYLAVVNWKKHQKIDKPSPSKFPPPQTLTDDSSSNTPRGDGEHSSLDQGPRSGSGIKDQGPQNGSGTGGGAFAQEYAFEGKIIRLRHPEFAKWKQTFSAIPDLRAELEAADAYYAPKEPSNWYFLASNWLKREHAKLVKQEKDEREERNRIY